MSINQLHWLQSQQATAPAATAPASRGGAPIVALIGVAFLVLKLAGIGAVASWPWVWVLAPFWAPLALVLVVFLVGATIIGITSAASGR